MKCPKCDKEMEYNGAEQEYAGGKVWPGYWECECGHYIEDKDVPEGRENTRGW